MNAPLPGDEYRLHARRCPRKQPEVVYTTSKHARPIEKTHKNPHHPPAAPLPESRAVARRKSHEKQRKNPQKCFFLRVLPVFRPFWPPPGRLSYLLLSILYPLPPTVYGTPPWRRPPGARGECRASRGVFHRQ